MYDLCKSKTYVSVTVIKLFTMWYGGCLEGIRELPQHSPFSLNCSVITDLFLSSPDVQVTPPSTQTQAMGRLP